MHTWSVGAEKWEGAQILRDGVPIKIEDVVSILNAAEGMFNASYGEPDAPHEVESRPIINVACGEQPPRIPHRTDIDEPINIPEFLQRAAPPLTPAQAMDVEVSHMRARSVRHKGKLMPNDYTFGHPDPGVVCDVYAYRYDAERFTNVYQAFKGVKHEFAGQYLGITGWTVWGWKLP